MKIREILELTKSKTIATIARDQLFIGEKPARSALKKAGCYSLVGKSGWYFDEFENPQNLDKSIYDFAKKVQEEEKAVIQYVRNLDIDSANKEGVVRKRHSFDLDVRLTKILKVYCAQKELTLYEVVEDSINKYLKSNVLNDLERLGDKQ